jgi:hypothetical protein
MHILSLTRTRWCFNDWEHIRYHLVSFHILTPAPGRTSNWNCSTVLDLSVQAACSAKDIDGRGNIISLSTSAHSKRWNSHSTRGPVTIKHELVRLWLAQPRTTSMLYSYISRRCIEYKEWSVTISRFNIRFWRPVLIELFIIIILIFRIVRPIFVHAVKLLGEKVSQLRYAFPRKHAEGEALGGIEVLKFMLATDIKI